MHIYYVTVTLLCRCLSDAIMIVRADSAEAARRSAEAEHCPTCHGLYSLQDGHFPVTMFESMGGVVCINHEGC